MAKNNHRNGLIRVVANIYVVKFSAPKATFKCGLYDLSYNESYLCEK